jgi:bifunctional non-homologous end joining protein LigD
MVRREGARVRCFTRNGHDWADRFPAIVDATRRLRARSFLIDGEAVVCRSDGLSEDVVRPCHTSALGLPQLDGKS